LGQIGISRIRKRRHPWHTGSRADAPRSWYKVSLLAEENYPHQHPHQSSTSSIIHLINHPPHQSSTSSSFIIYRQHPHHLSTSIVIYNKFGNKMASETKSFASSALASVPDLDENNWVDWYRRIDDALVNKNYLYRKIMDGTLARPIQGNSETETAHQTRLDKWEELQVQGRSTVNSKLGPTALLYVKFKGRVTVDGIVEDDLKTLFADLEERFRPQGVATFNRLQGNLLNLRLDDMADVTQFNNMFVKLDGELSLLSESARLPVPWMVGLYLNNLPSAYDTFKSHWISNNDFVDATKSKTILSELMQAVQKEEQLMQQTSSRTALLSHVNGVKGGGDKANVKCNHCGKLYHTEAECVVKHPHLKSALEKRMKQKRANREKKRAELKANSTLESSTTATPNQEPRTAAHLAIRGCATRFEPAFELDF
jgi:hypothetical protein